MSSYHLTPELIPYYLDALVRYRIKYLWGYSSALYTLAQEALRLGLNDLKLTVAITNAEPLYSYQRKTIAEAFACPVRETYGMSEIVVAASECEANHLHLWPEAGCLELTQDDQAVPRGEAGELICTGLVNTDMPLIRYRVGDRARLPEIDETCRCGRSLPMIAAIEGRADDVLYTSDGGRVGRLDPVFKEQLPVKEVQLIQEAIDRIRVLYVPAADFTDDATRSISKRLKDRMGNINVVFQEVDEVPRGANGKFRSVICQLSQAERLFEGGVTK
jgi:phenylacetate-CoA ligase